MRLLDPEERYWVPRCPRRPSSPFCRTDKETSLCTTTSESDLSRSSKRAQTLMQHFWTARLSPTRRTSLTSIGS